MRRKPLLRWFRALDGDNLAESGYGSAITLADVVSDNDPSIFVTSDADDFLVNG